jgi:hypothetical protein
MTTRHDCGGPVFGRLADQGDCGRCDELRSGAPPVVWSRQRERDDAARRREIRAHDCTASRCGVICTAFEW